MGLIGELIEPTGAAEKFEIVKLFVRGNFAGLGDRDGFGEQEAAGIAGVSNALGDLGAPGEPGGVEGVLEEECDVEFAVAEIGGEFFAAAPAAVNPVCSGGDELFAHLLITINVSAVGG